MRSNRVIFRMLPAAVAISSLISCDSPPHVDDENFVIDHDGVGHDYTMPNYSKVLNLRCTDANSDEACVRYMRSDCQELGEARGRHLGSHRVEWPEHADWPIGMRADSTDWMWVVLCETTEQIDQDRSTGPASLTARSIAATR